MMTERDGRAGTDNWSVDDPISFAWWKVKQKPFAITLTLTAAMLLIAFPNLVAGSIIASRAAARARGVVVPGDFTDLYLQVGGVVLGWITAGLFVGGMYRYILRLVRTGDASFGDLFSSINHFGSLFGISVLLGLPGLVLMVARPFLVTAGVPDVLVTASTIAVGVYIGVRWGFSSILAVDKGLSVTSALAESSRMTESRRLKLLGAVIVISLLTMVGACACGVGIIVTISIAVIAWVNIYIRLTGEPSRGEVGEAFS